MDKWFLGYLILIWTLFVMMATALIVGTQADRKTNEKAMLDQQDRVRAIAAMQGRAEEMGVGVWYISDHEARFRFKSDKWSYIITGKLNTPVFKVDEQTFKKSLKEQE